MNKVSKSKKRTKVSRKQSEGSDSTFLVKLVLYALLGATWIKFAIPLTVGSFQLNGMPIGLLFGIVLASYDSFSVDRKIEYAILVIMMVISYFLPAGIVL